jgi:hypothetical protein
MTAEYYIAEIGGRQPTTVGEFVKKESRSIQLTWPIRGTEHM